MNWKRLTKIEIVCKYVIEKERDKLMYAFERNTETFRKAKILFSQHQHFRPTKLKQFEASSVSLLGSKQLIFFAAVVSLMQISSHHM